MFQTSNNLRLDSPVRIAGVNVGKVTRSSATRTPTSIKVTMEMDDAGLPIHKDATLKIRSRIFLEGNFFVDLKPGTPAAPRSTTATRSPVTQTSTPVQLDELLTALQTNDREPPGAAEGPRRRRSTRKPTAADDATQDPDVRGKTRRAGAERAPQRRARVAQGRGAGQQALLGTEPHDLSKLIAGLAKVTTALGTNEEQLKDLITNFNRLLRVFAAQSTNAARRRSACSARRSRPPTPSLTSLNAALPAARGLRARHHPRRAGDAGDDRGGAPWIAQARALLARRRAGRPARTRCSRRPQTSRGSTTSRSTSCTQTNLTSRCFDEVILPAGDTA